MKPKANSAQAAAATTPPAGGVPCQCGSHSLPPSAEPGPIPDPLGVPVRPGVSTYVSQAGFVVIEDNWGERESAGCVIVHPDHLSALAKWLRQVSKPAVRRQLLKAMQERRNQQADDESAT